MKNTLHLFLILILILFSCAKDDLAIVTGTWEITFVITTDIQESPTYSGEMTLFHDYSKITGNIEISDDLGFNAYAELLPGGFVDHNNEISFETYVWLVNDSVTTLTLTYSGTITPPSKTGPGYYIMSGIFNSGERKIGDWSAEKR